MKDEELIALTAAPIAGAMYAASLAKKTPLTDDSLAARSVEIARKIVEAAKTKRQPMKISDAALGAARAARRSS